MSPVLWRQIHHGYLFSKPFLVRLVSRVCLVCVHAHRCTNGGFPLLSPLQPAWAPEDGHTYLYELVNIVCRYVCVYIYIYIYICSVMNVYTHIHYCAHIYVYIRVYTWWCIICMFLSIYKLACIFVCIYTCLVVNEHRCVCVCVCVEWHLLCMLKISRRQISLIMCFGKRACYARVTRVPHVHVQNMRATRACA